MRWREDVLNEGNAALTSQHSRFARDAGAVPDAVHALASDELRPSEMVASRSSLASGDAEAGGSSAVASSPARNSRKGAG